MGEKKSRHNYHIGLNNVFASVTREYRVYFLRNENCPTMPFCGALTAALGHYEDIKHVTEVGIYSSIALLIRVVMHCMFLDSFFVLDPLYTVLTLQMELSQDVPCPEERPCCSEEGQLPQGPGAQN